MAECTFFGHRDCPDSIRPLLVKQVEDLIENHDVTLFYVGYKGRFDAIVRNVLKDLSIVYPEILYGVVVSSDIWDKHWEELDNAITPEGVEDVHPRYATEWINRWMLRNSDYVISYVTHPWGGAAKFVAQARRQKKTVINLAETDSAGLYEMGI